VDGYGLPSVSHPSLTIVHTLITKKSNWLVKENRKQNQKNVPAAQTTVTAIRARLWMGVGCVTLAIISDNGPYPKAQRKALR